MSCKRLTNEPYFIFETFSYSSYQPVVTNNINIDAMYQIEIISPKTIFSQTSIKTIFSYDDTGGSINSVPILKLHKFLFR